MEIPLDQNWEAVRRAKQQAAPPIVILNLAPAGPVPAATLHNIDYLVVNEIEARELVELYAPAIRCDTPFLLLR
jgi:sugar/nucleoside kinase (ribokinase family)